MYMLFADEQVSGKARLYPSPRPLSGIELCKEGKHYHIFDSLIPSCLLSTAAVSGMKAGTIMTIIVLFPLYSDSLVHRGET